MARQHEVPYNEYGRLRDLRDDRWLGPDDQDSKVFSEGWQWNGFVDVVELGISDEERRARHAAFVEESTAGLQEQPPSEDFLGATVEVPGCAEEPDTGSYFLWRRERRHARRRLPVMFYVTGGGTVNVSPELAPLEAYAAKFDAVAVAPNYRDCVHAQYPAAINDLHAAYQYLVDNADDLGIRSDRIVLLGDSSGAQLVLNLAFRLKRYGLRPAGVVAMSPICDERGLYPSNQMWCDAWDGKGIHDCYRQYLGDLFASPFLGPEGMVSRATVDECRGLPPMFINTSELDPDRDATMAFASKLYEAQVYTSLHVWGGKGHLGPTLLLDDEIPGTEDDETYTRLVTKFVHDCLTADLYRSWREG